MCNQRGKEESFTEVIDEPLFVENLESLKDAENKQ